MHSAAEKRTSKRKPLKELYVDGTSRKTESFWEEELQRHCEEAYEDAEETIEIQDARIKKYKK